jgi:predicted 3-demethylubiquinone-9 3-methyltransferase (glyoxalase superfamily)
MKLKTHLMFQEGQAREAATFYSSLTDDAELIDVSEETGSVLANVRLAGHELVIFDSPVQHEFDMTPAVSLFLVTDSADQVDALFEKLAEGGNTFMPVGEYPFARRYGWCLDRFGVSWQIGFY